MRVLVGIHRSSLGERAPDFYSLLSAEALHNCTFESLMYRKRYGIVLFIEKVITKRMRQEPKPLMQIKEEVLPS